MYVESGFNEAFDSSSRQCNSFNDDLHDLYLDRRPALTNVCIPKVRTNIIQMRNNEVLLIHVKR